MNDEVKCAVMEPKKELIRWRELCDWLGCWGFTEDQVRLFTRTDLIRSYYIRHWCRKSCREVRGKAYYRVRQVREQLLRQFE